MRWRHAVLVAALAAATVACALDEVLPAPSCADGGSTLIAAQSVPTASQIPCLERLPDGWLIASVSIDQEGTMVLIDSDRAGESAATLQLVDDCDVSHAVSAPSELPAAARYDQIDRLEPGFSAIRYYVFPGGCVSWTFEFDDGASATESVVIGETLTLISREAFNDGIRESFVDEDI